MWPVKYYIGYEEKISKEEANSFRNLFKVKPDEPVRYNGLLEEIVQI